MRAGELYIPPADRDPEETEQVRDSLGLTRAAMNAAAARYDLAQVARADAVMMARQSGWSHAEIAAVLGVNPRVVVRLDQSRRVGPSKR
jgi:DNA-directed RNA polymerase specialized sigma24 family protein